MFLRKSTQITRVGKRRHEFKLCTVSCFCGTDVTITVLLFLSTQNLINVNPILLSVFGDNTNNTVCNTIVSVCSCIFI